MDTGRLITRQLRYALAGAETPEQTKQVEWWLAQVGKLRAQQPKAEAVEVAEAGTVEQLAPTGTEGGQ